MLKSDGKTPKGIGVLINDRIVTFPAEVGAGYHKADF